MCKEELVRVEKHTRVNVTVAVADATVGYGQLKRVASEAVRVADMSCRSGFRCFSRFLSLPSAV